MVREKPPHVPPTSKFWETLDIWKNLIAISDLLLRNREMRFLEHPGPQRLPMIARANVCCVWGSATFSEPLSFGSEQRGSHLWHETYPNKGRPSPDIFSSWMLNVRGTSVAPQSSQLPPCSFPKHHHQAIAQKWLAPSKGLLQGKVWHLRRGCVVLL